MKLRVMADLPTPPPPTTTRANLLAIYNGKEKK